MCRGDERKETDVNGTQTPDKPARTRVQNRFLRLVRYRLQIPLMRDQRPPEFTARGVMVGTVWAMLPLFGVQMAGVVLTWGVARRLFKWDFSLINALAWTWTTNVLTIIPAYYLFYVTGQALLGNWDQITGYQAFAQLFSGVAATDAGFFDALWSWLKALLTSWGVPIVVGSIPWAAFSGWLGYRLSLNFVRAYRQRRAERIAAAQKSRS